MNINKLKTLIAIMTRVRDEHREFDLNLWQEVTDNGNDDEALETEQAVVDCGTSCCVAGWLAVSPEFASIGGKVTGSGSPKIENRQQYLVGSAAVAAFLESSELTAGQICGFERTEDGDLVFPDVSKFYYGLATYNITPTTVVTRLTELLAEYEGIANVTA